jgi:hypothetical protein
MNKKQEMKECHKNRSMIILNMDEKYSNIRRIIMSIPGLLSTSYRCLQCQTTFKKREKDKHLDEYPMHEVYRSKQDQDWEEVISSQQELEQVAKENEQLKAELEREYNYLEELRKAIRALGKALDKEVL